MDKINLSIRFVEQLDLLNLKILFKQNNIVDITRNFNPFPLTEETACLITSSPHKDRYYVAFLHNTIVGFAMLRGWEEGYQIPSFGIFVDHKHHHMGIGRCLTNYVLKDAKILGCEKVRLSVYETNKNAISLYISLGFQETHRETVKLNDERVIKLIMEKNITE